MVISSCIAISGCVHNISRSDYDVSSFSKDQATKYVASILKDCPVMDDELWKTPGADWAKMTNVRSFDLSYGGLINIEDDRTYTGRHDDRAGWSYDAYDVRYHQVWKEKTVPFSSISAIEIKGDPHIEHIALMTLYSSEAGKIQIRNVYIDKKLLAALLVLCNNVK